MEKLDLKQINENKSKNIKIGELTQAVIDTLKLDLKPQSISLWASRLEEHCEKHKDEYSSLDAYYNAIQFIPEIITNPDYVGLHSKNGNLQYIKKLDDISLVGIKIIKGKNNLLFRTIFPITQDKLNYYIHSGKVIPLKK